MEPGRWRRLEDLFHAALERPEGDRRAFLETCGADDDLRAELERLLDADAHASVFTDDAAAGVGRMAATALSADTRIGAYRIVRELGRGGMGTVYLGERDEQFAMRVAIKLINRGMDTDGVLRRFLHERQILAGLEHPNIARLLDGGTTADGLPYFVMEYVDGQPIDAYCRDNEISLDRRLDLFRQVCAAVSYAHQHLVVHRDIKPSNILVTADGVPKLVDFGIARLLDTDDGVTLLTEAGSRAMTPQYASPEQLAGERVTTVSDVYALGVLLYELLTGTRPYDVSGKSAEAAGAVIGTTAVMKPSARAAAAGDDGLARRLRGDLDTIVLTAMRPAPGERYASAARLADDVGRHAEGLPVTARQASWTYRATRFVRRRKLAVSAAAAIAITLFGGVIATAWQARAAQAQAARAQRAQALAERRFSEVRKLANALIFDYHDAIRDLPGSTPVRAMLVRDALSYLNTLAGDAEGDPSLQRELAVAYRRVGDVQGGSTRINAGDTAGAAESYTRSLAILETLLRREPDDAGLRREVAYVSTDLSYLIWESGNLPGAIEHARRAQGLFEPLLATSPRDLDMRLAVGRAYDALGAMLLESGKPAEALPLHRRQLALLESTDAAEAHEARVRRARSIAHHHLADVEAASGDLEAALQSHRRSLALRESLADEFSSNNDYRRLVSTSHYWIGDVLAKLGRSREALDAYRRSLRVQEIMAAADPAADSTDMAFAIVQVGNMLGRLGDHAAALSHYRRAEALRIAATKADADSLWKQASLIESRVFICGSLAELRRAAEATGSCAAVFAQMNQTSVEPENALLRTFMADGYVSVGDAYATLGRSATAERQDLRRRARDAYQKGVDTFADLQRRGILAAADAAKPANAAAALARTDALLRSDGR